MLVNRGFIFNFELGSTRLQVRLLKDKLVCSHLLSGFASNINLKVKGEKEQATFHMTVTLLSYPNILVRFRTGDSRRFHIRFVYHYPRHLVLVA